MNERQKSQAKSSWLLASLWALAGACSSPANPDAQVDSAVDDATLRDTAPYDAGANRLFDVQSFNPAAYGLPSLPQDAGQDAGQDGALDSAVDSAVDGGVTPIARCPSPSICEAELPTELERKAFERSESTTVAMGAPRHRGRDLVVRVGQPATAIARFAYSGDDVPLVGEEVGVYSLLGCTGAWTFLGDVRTTAPGEHAAENGIEDNGGRIYLPLSNALIGTPGVHELYFFVRGDGTFARSRVFVLPEAQRFVVSDVDGTLTESEAAEAVFALGAGPDPMANPGSPEALQLLADRGFFIVYLTARPESFIERTKTWLFATRGYPLGLVRTTSLSYVAVGETAKQYKEFELNQFAAATGFPASIAFGNSASDREAYDAAAPMGLHLYFDFAEGTGLGFRQDDYSSLLPAFARIAPLCGN